MQHPRQNIISRPRRDHQSSDQPQEPRHSHDRPQLRLLAEPHRELHIGLPQVELSKLPRPIPSPLRRIRKSKHGRSRRPDPAAPLSPWSSRSAPRSPSQAYPAHPSTAPESPAPSHPQSNRAATAPTSVAHQNATQTAPCSSPPPSFRAIAFCGFHPYRCWVQP